MNRLEFRSSVLFGQGASLEAARELLEYNTNHFNHNQLALPKQFPLPAEPYLEAWEQCACLVPSQGTLAALKTCLVQLHFPIGQGMSRTAAYQSVTQKGVPPETLAEASGLLLRDPAGLQLCLYPSLAGTIPLIIAPQRDDFVSLVRALVKRNEPEEIPDSMGACIVAGYNNWGRIRELRCRWEAEQATLPSEAEWTLEFMWHIVPHPQLYQDTFIILSDGPYSNTAGEDLGVTAAAWRDISFSIRREHECTHYFTRRLFASMRNNLLDELIADYRGIVMAHGRYQAHWFLRFMGLESYPHYRPGGRLENYRGQPPLSEEAFVILQALVKAAAENLERFDHQYAHTLESVTAQAHLLTALTLLTLEELSSPEADSFLQQALTTVRM